MILERVLRFWSELKPALSKAAGRWADSAFAHLVNECPEQTAAPEAVCVCGHCRAKHCGCGAECFGELDSASQNEGCACDGFRDRAPPATHL